MTTMYKIKTDNGAITTIGNPYKPGTTNYTQRQTYIETHRVDKPNTVSYSSGTYNKDTFVFTDKSGVQYSTTDPAQLNKKLDITSVAAAPTSSVVGAVATKKVVENQIIEDVVKQSNVLQGQVQIMADQGVFKDIKTEERTGYYFGTMTEPGGLVSLGPLDKVFGSETPIATSKKTGETYRVITPTSSSRIDFVSDTISGNIYGENLKTGEIIELGSERKITKEEATEIGYFQIGQRVKEKGPAMVMGLSLGGGGTKAVVEKAVEKAAPTTAKQLIKPYLISTGLYVGGTQAPEISRQVALQTNKAALKDIEVGTPKFNKVIQTTFVETNQDYFGGTNYEIDEQGNVIKKKAVEGKAGILAKYIVGSFPALKANPVDFYDEEYEKNFKSVFKKEYGRQPTQDEVNAVKNVYLYAAGLGTGVGQVMQEVASEYSFRATSSYLTPKVMGNAQLGGWKTGVKLGATLGLQSSGFGFFEGASSQITQDSFEMQEQDPAKIVTSGLAGATQSAAFNFAGGTLTGRFGSAGGKLTQLGGWVVDAPGEIIGDKVTDLAIKDSFKTTLGGVSTVNIGGQGQTSTTTQTKSKGKSKGTGPILMDAAEQKAVNDAETRMSNWIKGGIVNISSPSIGSQGQSNVGGQGQGQGGQGQGEGGQGQGGQGQGEGQGQGGQGQGGQGQGQGEGEADSEGKGESDATAQGQGQSSSQATSVNIPIVTPANGDGFPFIFPMAGQQSKKQKVGSKLLYYNELARAKQFYTGLQYGGPVPLRTKKRTKKKGGKK